MVNGISIGGDSMGDPTFLRTETADELMQADVELKYDMFNDSEEMTQDLVEEWRSMVQNSSYWSQLQKDGCEITVLLVIFVEKKELFSSRVKEVL